MLHVDLSLSCRFLSRIDTQMSMLSTARASPGPEEPASAWCQKALRATELVDQELRELARVGDYTCAA